MDAELLIVSPYTISELRDTAALAGFCEIDMDKALKQIRNQYELQNSKEVFDVDGKKKTEIFSLIIERLQEILKEIKPRQGNASKCVEELNKIGMNRSATRLLSWVGWLSLPALGWAYSWLLERGLRQATTSSKDSNVVNDVIGLFSNGFGMMFEKLGKAIPFSDQHDWIFIAMGLILTIVGLFFYLKGQPVEKLPKLFSHGPDGISLLSEQYQNPLKLDTQDKKEKIGPNNSKKRPKRFELKDLAEYIFGSSLMEPSWLNRPKSRQTYINTAILFGLPGLGIVLSFLNRERSLAITLVGFAMAAVSAVVMIFLFRKKQGPVESESSIQLPTWFRKFMLSIAVATFLGFLFVVVWQKTNDGPAAAFVVIIAGLFLLLGSTALALGEVYRGIYASESYWLGLQRQLNQRIIKCRSKILEIQEKQKEVKEEVEKQWVLIQLEYENAYNIAARARILNNGIAYGHWGAEPAGSHWHSFTSEANATNSRSGEDSTPK